MNFFKKAAKKLLKYTVKAPLSLVSRPKGVGGGGAGEAAAAVPRRLTRNAGDGVVNVDSAKETDLY